MKITSQIEEAKKLHLEAIERMDESDARIQALPSDAPESERTFATEVFERSMKEADRAAETLERLVAIQRAKTLVPSDTVAQAAETQKIQVVNEPKTYRQDNQAQRSFFSDVVNAKRGDFDARERLERHSREVAHETRDNTTSSTAGGGFVPPTYLQSWYSEYAREGRPFADTVPSSPLMATGMSIVIPRITTGTAVTHIITQNSTAPAEQDIVDSNLTVPVVTIAGMNDVSQALFDRSEPGIDQVIFNDLRADYDRYLDTQMLSGTGSNGQHLGVRAVSGPNTTAYTTSTPTAAGLTPKLYEAISEVATNRYAPADTIVMHPRRSAWLASNLSSTFPLFQVGGLNQALGQQDVGAILNVSGLRVVSDANVGILYGASTTEDEIYVMRVADMHLWEGPLQARVEDQVGSGTLTIRLKLFAYSAFASERYAQGISVLSGTGLIAPTF